MAPPPRRSGFTLVEIMIVLSIIAILAAIMAPKFGALIRKSNEGATKAKLGTIRAALTIYYSSNEGIYPSDLTPLKTAGNKYLHGFPQASTAEHGTKGSVDYPAEFDGTLDSGSWAYVGTGSSAGQVWVECSHTDLAKKKWSEY